MEKDKLYFPPLADVVFYSVEEDGPSAGGTPGGVETPDDEW